MKLTRNQVIGGIVGLVIVALAAYGLGLYIKDHQNPYAGLVTSTPSALDEATNTYFQDRLNTTQAAVAAQLASGQEVDLNLYASIAGDAFGLGQWSVAREALEAELAGNSLNYGAWENYALVLDRMNDNENAEDAFKKALELQNGVEEYYRNYVDFLQTKYPERTDDVKAVLEASVTNLGQTAWNMVTLARWYVAAGDCDRAQDHYKVAVSLSAVNQAVKDEMLAAKQTCESKP